MIDIKLIARDDLDYYSALLPVATLLPVAYRDGLRLRKSIPSLPNASNPYGTTGAGSEKIKILGLGESSISGVGVETHDQGLTGRVAAHLANQLGVQIDWEVVAEKGYTARMVNDLLLPTLPQVEQDIFFVGLGGNDSFQMTKPTVWRLEMTRLLDQLVVHSPSAKIVCVNMPGVHDFPAFTPALKKVMNVQVDILRDHLADVAADRDEVLFLHDKIYLEAWSERHALTHPLEDYYSDGVHPSAVTYNYWGKDVAHQVASWYSKD